MQTAKTQQIAKEAYALCDELFEAFGLAVRDAEDKTSSDLVLNVAIGMAASRILALVELMETAPNREAMLQTVSISMDAFIKRYREGLN